jgi:hypothetical protein
MRFALIATLLCLSAGSAFAQAPDQDRIDADRPGLADASTVVGRRVVQFESGIQWEKRGSEQLWSIPTLFRVGVSDRWEARVEGNTFTTVGDGGDRHSGLAPTSLGVAAALLDAHDNKPGVGVIARVFPAWGTGDFASHETTADVRLAVDWDFAPRLSLNPNVGAGFYEGDPGHFACALLAMTLTFEAKPGVSWFVDAGSQTPESEGGTTSLLVDAGLAYIPRRNWQFDVSTGTRAHGDTPARPFVAVGVSVRAGR